jgi:hypothetical protein
VSRGDDEVLREQAFVARNSSNGRKDFSKTFEKPLDKYQVLWYNISVRKRGNKYGKVKETVTRGTP